MAVVALFFQFTTSSIASDANKSGVLIDSNNTADQKTENLKKSVQDSAWVKKLEQNLGQKFLGISAWQFLAAFLSILVGLIFKRILVGYIEKKIETFVKKTEAEWDDLLFEAITKPVNAFIMIGAVHVAAFILVFNLENFPTNFIGKSYTVLLGLILVWGVYRLVDVVAHYLDELVSRSHDL